MRATKQELEALHRESAKIPGKEPELDKPNDSRKYRRNSAKNKLKFCRVYNAIHNASKAYRMVFGGSVSESSSKASMMLRGKFVKAHVRKVKA